MFSILLVCCEQTFSKAITAVTYVYLHIHLLCRRAVGLCIMLGTSFESHIVSHVLLDTRDVGHESIAPSQIGFFEFGIEDGDFINPLIWIS
jgi:hypothetical protein